MQPNTRKTPVLFIAALLAIFMLASSACSFSVANESPNTSSVEMEFQQEDFDLLFQDVDIHWKSSVSSSHDDLLDHITSVELHDGTIRFVGKVKQADRSEADGSFDLRLWVENGKLKGEVVAVNVPGVDLTDPRVVEANQRMEEEFGRLGNRSHNDVTFQEVMVEEGLLRMKIQVGTR